MKAYIGFTNITGFEISDIAVFNKEGKDIKIKRVKETYHSEECWKGWLPLPDWNTRKSGRIFVILSCGHYFSGKCFFEHSFEKCPHCHLEITQDDKKELPNQLFNCYNRVKSSKSMSLKIDYMYILRALLENSFEQNDRRWTNIACEMYKYHLDNKLYYARISIPSLLVLNYIMEGHSAECSKIFRMITWEEILLTSKYVRDITKNFTFLSHLDFFRKSLLHCEDDDREKNIERLERFKIYINTLKKDLPSEYKSDQTTGILNSILKNIEDELERNRTMLDIERYQYQSDSDPEPEEYEGDYDLRRYRDEEYDSDTLPAYDYKKITKHYSDKLPK